MSLDDHSHRKIELFAETRVKFIVTFYFIYGYSITSYDTKALLHMATMHQVNNHVHHDSWRWKGKVSKEETMLEDSEATVSFSHLLIILEICILLNVLRIFFLSPL